jgi:hypothetical protein
MKKLNNKINLMKNNNSNYFKYMKCFINNDKAKELFVRNESFGSLKEFMSNKKVS